MKPTLLLFTMAFSLFGHGASSEPLAVGADAPVINAVDQDGETINLGDHYSKGMVLVYFYPKADTPGCTAQGCSLRDEFETLTRKGVEVFGVSTDDPKAQKAFKEKFNLPFTLIADTDKTVVTAFGVPTRDIPLVGSLASRQAFLIKGGKIVWRDLKASTKEQAADVLAAIATLGD